MKPSFSERFCAFIAQILDETSWTEFAIEGGKCIIRFLDMNEVIVSLPTGIAGNDILDALQHRRALASSVN